MSWLVTMLVRWIGGPEDKSKRYAWAAAHPARISLLLAALMSAIFAAFALALSASLDKTIRALAIGSPAIFVAYYVAIRLARRAPA